MIPTKVILFSESKMGITGQPITEVELSEMVQEADADGCLIIFTFMHPFLDHYLFLPGNGTVEFAVILNLLANHLKANFWCSICNAVLIFNATYFIGSTCCGRGY